VPAAGLQIDTSSYVEIAEVAGQPREISIDELKRELQEFDLLCAAVGDGDGAGKLRGKLNRLHESLTSLEATGDRTAFREDLRSATGVAEHLHSLEPLTRLLERLSALDRQIAEVDSPT
jgi:hypothetical protein